MDAKVKEFIVQSALIVDEKMLAKIKDLTFEHINSLLESKGEEYSQKVNRLENFLDGAAMDKETPEETLYGMVKKHWLSIMKFIREIPTGKRHDILQWIEKTDDIITYMILLKAMAIKRQEIEYAIDKKTKEQYGEGPAEKAFKDVLKKPHTEPRIGTVYNDPNEHEETGQM
jgi:hypothetical protein